MWVGKMQKRYTNVSVRTLVVVTAVAIGTLALFFIASNYYVHTDRALPPNDVLLGQALIVGIPGKSIDDRTRIFLEKTKPAGIILYKRNYENLEQLQTLISELQRIAKVTTDVPYFITIDEEPGGATRLGLFKNVFASGTPDWEQIEEDVSRMASVGITVNLAPSADFPFNKDSFIRDRVQARSTEALTQFNRRFIGILSKNEIDATVKHFPGMGMFKEDPHDTVPHTNASKEDIVNSVALFEDAVRHGARFVMTGHVVYESIDPDLPVTLSSVVITDYVRKKMKFDGMLMTDDLSDMPFFHTTGLSIEEGAARALLAGHNLLLFSHNQRQTEEIVEQLQVRMNSDVNFKNYVLKNYDEVVQFKKR